VRIRLELSYDGTHYHGWQRQAPGQPTIQSELEGALAKLLNEPIRVVGSGRTDAGVHAVRQTAHFTTTRDPSRYNMLRALGGLLPKDIVVRQAYQAPDDFHSLFSAECKTYRYLIQTTRLPPTFRRHYVYWMDRRPSLNALNAICSTLLGTHDFKSFQTGGSEVESTTRTIKALRFVRREASLIEFRITGTGFLKQMVRNIVGTCLYLERNNLGPAEMQEILQARDRRAAKDTAPPQGLYLWRVFYPENLDKKCRKI
jgi:tRNA pseudouridine38-40 synthase